MRHIVVFPIKSYSERIPNKNFRKIMTPEFGVVPLYAIMPSRAINCRRFEHVYIDTDSDEVKNWAQSNGISVINRAKELASNNANGNDLIRAHYELLHNKCDVLWQGFVTAPRISRKTLDSLIDVAEDDLSEGQFDSIFTVEEMNGFFWSDSRLPLTYRTDVLPRGQNLPSIYKEVSGLFGITHSGFEKTRSRIGVDPWMFILPSEEALDIDWPSDLPRA